MQKNEASPGKGAAKQQDGAHGGSQHVVDLPWFDLDKSPKNSDSNYNSQLYSV